VEQSRLEACLAAELRRHPWAVIPKPAPLPFPAVVGRDDSEIKTFMDPLGGGGGVTVELADSGTEKALLCAGNPWNMNLNLSNDQKL